MTGIEDYNFPAFHAAAADWRREGWQVVNPADHFDGDQTLSYPVYMREDIKALLSVDAIALLPGWEHSKGARLEHDIARALGLEVRDALLHTTIPDTAPPPVVPNESALEEAQRLVHGNRGADYGHPIVDFSRTAAMWSGMWREKLTAPIEPGEVALAMILVKVSREMNRAKRDNAVDIAGYAETLTMVREREQAEARHAN
jgi:hypothetical protein